MRPHTTLVITFTERLLILRRTLAFQVSVGVLYLVRHRSPSQLVSRLLGRELSQSPRTQWSHISPHCDIPESRYPCQAVPSSLRTALLQPTLSTRAAGGYIPLIAPCVESSHSSYPTLTPLWVKKPVLLANGIILSFRHSLTENQYLREYGSVFDEEFSGVRREDVKYILSYYISIGCIGYKVSCEETLSHTQFTSGHS
ncbi:hypothetical protein RRG08_039398 [Elysia crispata]|uniref:Uncharacterized protein n=1 Tax=Elysia crispata TaxID=231223 RepID=A0AAE0XVS9_9GAST|nr:hypothetical protein RRG08_039398 [Elysia crispata]